MIISRERAQHMLEHDYKQHTFAEGRVTKILNTDYGIGLWMWEVKLSNASIDKHRIKIYLQKRPYKLCAQTFRNAETPKVGSRVILRSCKKSADTKFSPYKATVYAIISRN